MPQNITPAISISCVRTVHIHRIWEKSSVLFCDISFYLRLFYFRVLTGKINPLLHQLILQPEPGHQFLKHGSLAGQLLVGAVISVFPPQIIFSHPPYKGQFSKDSCSGKLFKLFLFYQLKIRNARHFCTPCISRYHYEFTTFTGSPAKNAFKFPTAVSMSLWRLSLEAHAI